MTISGTITLKSGETIEVTDETLVKNGLSVSMSTCSYSKFLIGSFTAAEMRLKIYDDDAIEHEFSGAEISLSVKESEDGPETPLGIYYVDGAQSVREKKQISLVAYDRARKFDNELPINTNEGEEETEPLRINQYSPLGALTLICSRVGVPLASSNLSEFPNSGVQIKLSSKCIVSYRDAVMHIAALLCANAVINRNGELEIRRARYRSEGSSIIEDWIITGDERVKTQFSDIRTFINNVTVSLGGGSQYRVRSSISPSDVQARGAVSSVWCVLMENKQTGIDWLTYIDGFKQRKIKTQIFSNARIKLGDTCRFSGGSIDIRRSIVGVVTGIRWKYNGLTEIQCAAPEAIY